MAQILYRAGKGRKFRLAHKTIENIHSLLQQLLTLSHIFSQRTFANVSAGYHVFGNLVPGRGFVGGYFVEESASHFELSGIEAGGRQLINTILPLCQRYGGRQGGWKRRRRILLFLFIVIAA